MSDLIPIKLAEQAIANLEVEIARLEQQVKYWRIEAECDHARWLRVMEENDQLRLRLRS